MITGKEAAVKYFERSGQDSWILYAFGKSNSADIVCSSTEGISTEKAAAELYDFLSYAKGRFSLACVTGGKRSPRSDWRCDVEISATQSTPQQMQPISGITPEEIKDHVAAGIEKYKTEVRLTQLENENRDLKKKVADLEKEAEEPINKIIAGLSPFIPHLMGGVQQAVAGMPGTVQQPQQQQQQSDLTPEDAERLEVAINELAALESDWLSLLEKIVSLAKANPQYITMIKSM